MNVFLGVDSEKSLKYTFEKILISHLVISNTSRVYVLKIIMHTPFKKNLLKLFGLSRKFFEAQTLKIV